MSSLIPRVIKWRDGTIYADGAEFMTRREDGEEISAESQALNYLKHRYGQAVARKAMADAYQQERR